MHKLPPLPAMRAFEAVARLGSITLAAKELHLTHSAISHQIKALEAFIGINLIDRIPAAAAAHPPTASGENAHDQNALAAPARRMMLTPEGRIYAYQIRLSLQQLSAATQHITHRNAKEHITIGMLPSFGTHWLVPRLAHFVELYPHIELELVASLEVVDFDKEPLDCTVRFGNSTQIGSHSLALMHDWVCLVAASTDTRYSPEMPPQDVALQGPILQSHEVWSMWAQSAGVEMNMPEHVLKFNDSNLSLQAARLGLGACYTRWSIAAQWVKEGTLQRVSPVLAPHQSSYHLVWPPRSHGSEKLSLITDWLKLQCAAFERETLLLTQQQG